MTDKTISHGAQTDMASKINASILSVITTALLSIKALGPIANAN